MGESRLSTVNGRGAREPAVRRAIGPRNKRFALRLGRGGLSRAAGGPRKARSVALVCRREGDARKKKSNRDRCRRDVGGGRAPGRETGGAEGCSRVRRPRRGHTPVGRARFTIGAQAHDRQGRPARSRWRGAGRHCPRASFGAARGGSGTRAPAGRKRRRCTLTRASAVFGSWEPARGGRMPRSSRRVIGAGHS